MGGPRRKQTLRDAETPTSWDAEVPCVSHTAAVCPRLKARMFHGCLFVRGMRGQFKTRVPPPVSGT